MNQDVLKNNINYMILQENKKLNILNNIKKNKILLDQIELIDIKQKKEWKNYL